MSNTAALVFRLVSLLLLLGVASFGSAFVMRLAFPEAWNKRWRRMWLGGVGVAAVAMLAWTIGRGAHSEWLIKATAPVVAVILMAALALFATSPAWGAAGGIVRATPVKNPARRAFLGKFAGALPAGAALAGPIGAVSSTQKPLLREVELRTPLVPRALDGMTILQISDVHLGSFIDVTQVEAVVDAAREKRPDLVALTGDIADDYAMLPPALAAVATLAPRLGTFAILGNHEVYRGRDEAIRLFKDGGARFLCDEGVVVEHNGAHFWLAGTDDPARLRGDLDPYYARSLQLCMAERPADVDATILLAHRPLAFDHVEPYRVAVQLSGHTHGAQMALFGRSLLEGIVPMKYLLGRYTKGDSVLFTTAGLGHWFPFRLNCPTEAALITLRTA